MRASLDTASFLKTMNNVVGYSVGFVEGAQQGKRLMLDTLGKGVIEALARYVDVNAKMNPRALHHMYEWYQEGSPAARLFDLQYTVSNLGLSVGSTFRQSSSASKNSSRPFYDKARIMEQGIPVTIVPKSSGVLVFEDNGQTVFTKRPITIFNPGGIETEGSYERVFDEFMNSYFKQSFLSASGLFDYIKRPNVFKKELPTGAKFGKQTGKSVGYKWIANFKMGVDNG